MDKSPARQTFTRLLVLAMISVAVIALCYLIGTTTAFTAILVTLFLFANAFALLFYWVYITTDLLKHLFDKQKEYFDIFYLTNVLFMTIVILLFLSFYFQLLGGALIQLLT